MTNQQKGIGLLELMLALAIIAMLMVSATRYYKHTQVMRKVQIAVSSVQALYGANERWLQDGHAAATSIDDLINAAYLPSDFKATANPWDVTITFSGNTITFSTVPAADCANAKAKISKFPFVDTSGTTCKATTTTPGDMVITIGNESES